MKSLDRLYVIENSGIQENEISAYQHVIEVNEKNGNFSQGKRIRVDVMMKDSIKYSSTGGWGYDEFKESSKTERILTSAARTACFNCHSNQKDYIFSEFAQ